MRALQNTHEKEDIQHIFPPLIGNRILIIIRTNVCCGYLNIRDYIIYGTVKRKRQYFQESHTTLLSENLWGDKNKDTLRLIDES